MNPVLQQIYETGHVINEDGTKREAFPAGLPQQDGQTLYNIVKDTKPARTLEVGMAFGISTLFICDGLSENGGGSHTAIDPWQEKWWKRVALLNAERAGYKDMVRFFAAPSYEVLPQLLGAGERFDFIFIDGNHRFEYTLVDFFYADKLLNTGGHVMLHDPWLPGIRKVVSFIAANRANDYEPAEAYMPEKPNAVQRLRLFQHHMRDEPYDIQAARYFSANRFHNFCVFKKTADPGQESFDQAWDFYRSF